MNCGFIACNAYTFILENGRKRIASIGRHTCTVYIQGLKVQKHEIFYKFFCTNRFLMAPRPCITRIFNNRIRYGQNIRILKISMLAESALKSFMRWLSQRWNGFHVWFWNEFKFPLCWACAKIGYWLAENAQKLVTHWLRMRENWLLVGWAYEKIISAHHVHFQTFSSVPPVTHSSVLFSRPCLTSYVPCLTSLFLVSCPLSSVSRLFLTSRPLSHAVLRLFSLSTSPVLCPFLASQFLVSCPYSVSHDLSPVSHPLFSVP
jgi:hypothetical protein